MLTTFDPDRGVLFKGEFTKVDCVDPARTGHRRNLVIDRAKPFEIEIEWRLDGDDVPLYLAALDNPLGSNNWTIEAYAESLGPGPEVQIAAGTVPVGARTDPKVYQYTLTVPANTLQEGNPGGGPNSPSGVYKLIVTCFLNSTLGAPGFDIAGFAEGPIIRVESPV